MWGWGKEVAFFILCSHLWDEVPRGGLKQEIWADQESYLYKDLMVGQGEKGRGWWMRSGHQSSGVETQTMNPLSLLGSILQRSGIWPEVRDLRNPDSILACWFSVFESTSPRCGNLGLTVKKKFFFFKSGKRTERAKALYWRLYKNCNFQGERSSFSPLNAHPFIHSLIHSHMKLCGRHYSEC